MDDFIDEEQHLDELQRQLARARADIASRFGDIKAAIKAARRGDIDPATIDRERLRAYYVELYGDLDCVEHLLAMEMARPIYTMTRELWRRKAELELRIPIEAFIGGSQDLERRGEDLVGVCPFHKDDRLSMYVVPSKRFYHCFACAAHGSVVDYDLNRRGISTEQSIVELEARLAAGEDPIVFRETADA